MALVTYGVDADVVMLQFAQLDADNADIPGTTVITSEWIDHAAARVEEAMLDGGFSSSVVNSTDYPAAYYILRNLVSRLAAIEYAEVLGVPTDNDVAVQMRRDADNRLSMIRDGARIGELTNVDGAQGARLYLGDDTEADLDAHRAGFDDML